MKISEKLVAFLNNNKNCMVSLKNLYANPYRQYSYERGNFYETTITHYPKISGVYVEVEIRKYETHTVVHNIKVGIYGMNNWANECPTVYSRRERLLNFLNKEIASCK